MNRPNVWTQAHGQRLRMLELNRTPDQEADMLDRAFHDAVRRKDSHNYPGSGPGIYRTMRNGESKRIG